MQTANAILCPTRLADLQTNGADLLKELSREEGPFPRKKIKKSRILLSHNQVVSNFLLYMLTVSTLYEIYKFNSFI